MLPFFRRSNRNNSEVSPPHSVYGLGQTTLYQSTNGMTTTNSGNKLQGITSKVVKIIKKEKRT